MSNSDKINALPWLGWIWNMGPFESYLVMFGLCFGAVALLMYAEGVPFGQRPLYRSFWVNGAILIPSVSLLTVAALQDGGLQTGFYTSTQWQLGLFMLGVAISVLLELSFMRSGYFTWRQEISPSKLWQTVIFGFVFYWVAQGVAVSFAAGNTVSKLFVVIIAGLMLDAIAVDWHRERPFDNVHLEGSWIPWNWCPRKR